MPEEENITRYAGAYTKRTATCPYCGTKGCEADWVDVGIGLVQCGPFICWNCGASEIGPHDENHRDEDEKRTGWFKAGNVGTSVNTCNGVPVDHDTALGLYRAGLLDEKTTLFDVTNVQSPLTEWDEQQPTNPNPELPP